MSFETALVTGASGFIGRALTAHLIAQGKRVIVTGRPGASRLPDAHRVIRMDQPAGKILKNEIGTDNIDIVFHCAGYGVMPTERDPAQMLTANVSHVAAWVEAAAYAGARAMVYAGSCSEYGRVAEEIPIVEDTPLGARDLYGASKAAGGLWGKAAAHNAGIGFLWLRIFGVFGPGEAPHRLLPYLTAKLSKAERVDLTPGQQVRDLLYIEDAVRGMEIAAEAAWRGNTGTFNLCSGKPITIRGFAEIIASALDAPAGLLDFGGRDYRPDEQLWMVGNPAKFADLGDFRPEIDIQEGISRALHAMRAATATSSKIVHSPGS